MSFADLIEAAQAGDTPPTVTQRHEAWLADGGRHTPEAIAFGQEQLASGRMGGKTRLRASDAGACPRRRLMQLLGVKPEPVSAALQNTFQTGHFLHLKWQMAGLSAGWLAKGEAQFVSEDGLYRGKADGVLDDGGIFELKTAGEFMWRQAADHPLPAHALQAEYAMLALDAPYLVVVYEHKKDGAWVEHTVPRTEQSAHRVAEDLLPIADALEDRRLPFQKPLCVQREGREYKQCPHRVNCPAAEMLVDWEGKP